MNKKEMLILGALAIGGVGIATMVSDSGDAGGGRQARPGGILGTQRGATVYNLPAQPAVTFPESPTLDLSKLLGPMVKPTVSRGAAGVSAAPKPKKEPVIYGGYTPSGKSYVFGGKAFEQRAVKEVVTKGYSPTLGAAFGIKGGAKKTVLTTKGSAVKKRVAERRAKKEK